MVSGKSRSSGVSASKINVYLFRGSTGNLMPNICAVSLALGPVAFTTCPALIISPDFNVILLIQFPFKFFPIFTTSLDIYSTPLSREDLFHQSKIVFPSKYPSSMRL